MFKIGHMNKGQGIARFLALFLCVGFADAMGGQVFDVPQEQVPVRFKVLEAFKGDAILDLETQLIWERSPSTQGAGWTHAPLFCATKTVGGRKGWRLPTFLELMTLVDPLGKRYETGTVLPTGHPFQGIKADSYWTVTSSSTNDRQAYSVDFFIGDIAAQKKSRISNYWCVRGGIQSFGKSNRPQYVSETL